MFFLITSTVLYAIVFSFAIFTVPYAILCTTGLVAAWICQGLGMS